MKNNSTPGANPKQTSFVVEFQPLPMSDAYVYFNPSLNNNLDSYNLSAEFILLPLVYELGMSNNIIFKSSSNIGPILSL